MTSSFSPIAPSPHTFPPPRPSTRSHQQQEQKHQRTPSSTSFESTSTINPSASGGGGGRRSRARAHSILNADVELQEEEGRHHRHQRTSSYDYQEESGDYEMERIGTGGGRGRHGRKDSRGRRRSGDPPKEEEVAGEPFETNDYAEALALSSDSLSDSDTEGHLASSSSVGESGAGTRRRNSYTRRDYFQKLTGEELGWMAISASSVLALVVGAVLVVVLG